MIWVTAHRLPYADQRNLKKLETMSLIKFKHQTPAWGTFDNLFNDFFEGEFTPRKFVRAGSVPAANIKETEKDFQIELAVPGRTKEEFKIELNEDLLSISSESSKNKEEKKEGFTKREFNYSSFKRSFRMPEIADAEGVNANYDNGLLTISIPKLEAEENLKRREIAVS